MSIVGEYSDEGKSGKSVEGRPQFKQMLADVESGKDNVDYVLVFKLSRFGEMLQMFYRHCRKCRIMELILSV